MPDNPLKEAIMPEEPPEVLREYLYLIRPTRPAMLTDGATPDEQRLIGEHFAYLQGLVAGGVAHLVGRTMTTDEHTLGLMLFHADSDAAAQAILAADPAIRNGVFRGEVRPFQTILSVPYPVA
jgi:uncharacterized protein YciI